MLVAGFVAPYLLDTTTRFVEAAAGLPDVELALITTEPADRLSAAVEAQPGRALADRRPARRRPDRRGRRGALGAAGPGAAVAGRAGATAGPGLHGPRAPGHTRHGRGHGPQLPGQGPDEDGSGSRGRALRPAPPGHRRGRSRRLRPRGRLPAGGQAAGRRRGQEYVPPGRPRRPGSVAGGRRARPGPARADRGVPDRGGGLVRQRDGRRADRLGLDLGVPADPAGGAAPPVDAVGGPAAPRRQRARLRRASRGVAPVA